MDQNGILMTYVMLELTDGLQKRRLSISPTVSAYLNDGNTVLVLFFAR